MPAHSRVFRSTLAVAAALFGAGLLGAGDLQSLKIAGGARVPISDLPLESHRIEFRLHGLRPPFAEQQTIFDIGQMQYCAILPNSTRMQCQNRYDGTPDGVPSIDFGQRTDLRVRYQRDLSYNTATLEIWDGNCGNYDKRVIRLLPQSITARNEITFGPGLEVAFFRFYTRLTSSGACPLDSPAETADKFDFRFEGETPMRSRTGGYTMQASQSEIEDSPEYAPLAAISGWKTFKPVFRAGTPFKLTGASSTTFRGDGQASGFAWQQVSGPAPLTFASEKGTEVTLTAPVAGNYRVRLTVTDSSGRSGSAEADIGVVATDREGRVFVANPEMAWILGPLTIHGENPWPWYDITEAAAADALRPFFLQPVTDTPLAGTVTITADAPNKTEDGLICCQPLVRGTGTTFTADLKAGDLIWLWWDRDRDGSYRGRALSSVHAIENDTSLRLGDYYWTHEAAQSVNMKIAKAAPDVAGYTMSSQPSTSWNYYEALLGVYRLHARTGLAVYLEQARALCRNWWIYGLDSGYRITVPRNSGWQGMMACAADNEPGWWPGIAHNVSRGLRAHTSFNPQTNATPGKVEVRESAYELRATAIMAKVYAPHTERPEETRTAWCGYLKNQIRRIWIPAFVSIGDRHGYWPEDLFGMNTSYPAAPSPTPAGNYGTAPWRANGLSNLALTRAWEVLTDPAGCPDEALAATVMNIIEKSARFIYDYGRSPDGGLYYNVLYETGQGQQPWNTPLKSPAGAVVTMTNGSNQITATGVELNQMFAPCDGSTYIGFHSTRKIYRVLSCSGSSAMTLETPYQQASGTDTAFVRAVRAQTSCSPSIAPFCEPDQYSGRNLSHDIAASFSWLYARTGDPEWRRMLDYFAGRAYGGPAGGPGTSGAPAGPEADGQPNNFASVLPPCGKPPCGGYGAGSTMGKPFGMSAGAGNAPNAVAERMGAPPPFVPRQVEVSFTIAAPAVWARLTVIQPSGARSVAICSSSPCAVSVDPRQGDHQVRIEYLNAAMGVVGRGAPVTLRVAENQPQGAQ